MPQCGMSLISKSKDEKIEDDIKLALSSWKFEADYVVEKFLIFFENKRRSLSEKGKRLTCQERKAHFHVVLYTTCAVTGPSVITKLHLSNKMHATNLREPKKIWLPYLYSISDQQRIKPYRWSSPGVKTSKNNKVSPTCIY